MAGETHHPWAPTEPSKVPTLIRQQQSGEGDQARRCSAPALSGTEGGTGGQERPAELGRGTPGKGLGPEPLLCAQVTRGTAQKQTQRDCPAWGWTSCGLFLGRNRQRELVGRKSRSSGAVTAATLSRRPQRGWLKLVPTRGRPGSKHSGVSMEIQQRRTRWGLGMGRAASAWSGWGS